MKKVILVGLVFWTIVSFSSTSCAQSADIGRNTQLTIYIEGPKNVDMDVSLGIKEILIASQSDTISIQPLVRTVSSTMISNNQILLAEAVVPTDGYDSFIFHFDSIKSYAGKAGIYPGIDSSGLKVPLTYTLKPNSSQVLFIQWTPSENEYVEGNYIPNFLILKNAVPPIGSILFVTNQDSDNLSVIDIFEHKVVDVIRVDEGPTDIIYSPIFQQIYVANADASVISVIDMYNQSIVRNINLNFDDSPSQLMLSPDEDILYVLNYGSSSLTVIDLFSYEETNNVNIDHSPTDMAVDRITGNVYIASRYSDYLQIYDVTNQILEPLFLPNVSPAELELSYDPKQLFITEQTQRKLSTLDAVTGTMKSSVNVCAPITSLAYCQNSRMLYGAMARCKTISIIDPENNLETGTITLNYVPGKLSLDKQDKHLIVTYPDENKIAYYNINTKKLVSEINVGRKPHTAVQP